MILPFLDRHVDALTGSVLGLGTSAPMAVGAIDTPVGAPWWAPYIMTMVVALAPVLLKALLTANGKKLAPDDEKVIDAVGEVAEVVVEHVEKPQPPQPPEVKP